MEINETNKIAALSSWNFKEINENIPATIAGNISLRWIEIIDNIRTGKVNISIATWGLMMFISVNITGEMNSAK
jgi:hypothetical protein